jgi:LDH2 family malate/lactate/ureidoglycolate dehydrogenase
MVRQNDDVALSLETIETLSRDILSRHGLSPQHVAAVTHTIVAGERDECTSHGMYRLLVCTATIAKGRVALDADPVVTSVAPALVRVDAGGGFAQLAFERGLPILIDKAKACGIAALAINRCVHFAALWPEIEAITAHDLVALACTPSHAWVAPAGGTRPLFGTNPLAFGWPRPGTNPYVFDFATSAVARGEIELHRRAGKAIPEGWAIDRDGRPTTDAAAALAGAMLTFGGHKGSALSTMIELLAGPLIGDLTSVESLASDNGEGASPLGGELIIAMDPATFLGAAVVDSLQRAEVLFDGIVDQGARLPSQRRYEARARTPAAGMVHIPRALHQELLRLLEP